MDPKDQAAQLPERPGVYLFKDATGAVIYVGKANSLRNRVRSYFLESRWIDAKTGSLAREIADLETIVVENGREALALENNLIKQYHPKFNIMLRDDKTYPYIKFTAAEKFHRVYFTRRIKKDGGEDEVAASELARQRSLVMLELMDGDLVAMPGLNELLEYLRPRYRLALAKPHATSACSSKAAATISSKASSSA